MPGRVPSLPLDYRADLLAKVAASIVAGECCSLIGISGTGKSNLARFLRRRDVQQRYWGEEPVWVLLLDSQSMSLPGEHADAAVLETLVQLLLEEAQSRPCAPQLLEQVQQVAIQVEAHLPYNSLLRKVQALCSAICEEQGIRVLVVCDQFEDLWQHLPAQFFLNLRHLRDQFKYQLVFLLMTRDRLANLRPDYRAVEAFWELFSAHTYSLSPFGRPDALNTLERLAIRTDSSPPSELVERMLELGGSHPGMLRAVFWAALHSQWQSVSPAQYLQHAVVSEECQKIWVTLPATEQQVVQLLARQIMPSQPQDVAMLEGLVLKGVIYPNPLRLFSPIFAAYVIQQSEHVLEGVCVDRQKRQVWLDGQLIEPPLSKLSFKLVAYLALHAGSVCHRAELFQELYPEERQLVDDQRLNALLTRVRKALGETGQQAHYIVTHPGGIQLVKGRILN